MSAPFDENETPEEVCFATELPDGARVHQLSADLALIELPESKARVPAGLTEAEQQIACAVFEGATNQQIAKARGVSVKTVDKQLESLYRKLGVSSRVELVLELRQLADALD